MSHVDAVVRMKKVSFAYGGNYVVQDVSLDILQGDFIAVVGPNGAGKSTLVKLALGLLVPETGSVELFGQDIGRFSNWPLVGYVPQKAEIGANFPASVAEILFTLKEKPVGQNVLKLLHLDAVLHKRFADLSGGQQQKVLVALALASDPHLLILDEPTVGVDISSQRNFYSMLKKLNEEMGTTIVLVTHDVGMVQHFVKSVVCINKSFCCKGKPEHMEELVHRAYGQGFEVHKHKR